MYRDSTSPIASPLVIATKPFIRFCGDYRQVNTYIHIGHNKIPIVKDRRIYLKSASTKFSSTWTCQTLSISLNLDQLPLFDSGSKRRGGRQVEPKFMPEGVGPASFHLQSVVSTVFADFSDWLNTDIHIWQHIAIGSQQCGCVCEARTGLGPLHRAQCLPKVFKKLVRIWSY